MQMEGLVLEAAAEWVQVYVPKYGIEKRAQTAASHTCTTTVLSAAHSKDRRYAELGIDVGQCAHTHCRLLPCCHTDV